MTRDDVLKEFVKCHCSYVCECYEFVYEAMADEIVALRAERDAQHATYTALHDALVIAEGQRDQLRAERDALRNEWSGLLIEQARLMALRDEAVQKRDEAIAERDALREAIDTFLSFQGSTREQEGQAALAAALSALEVQP